MKNSPFITRHSRKVVDNWLQEHLKNDIEIMEFKQYQRKGLLEMIPLKDFVGQVSTISVSDANKLLFNEEFMLGYIARNPKNHEDKWYVSKKYFEDNLELVSNPSIIQDKLNGLDIITKMIAAGEIEAENISDGYHTFNELYEFRKMYNAALFNEWAESWKVFQQYKDSKNAELQLAYKNAAGKYNVHKSWKHHDGELAFGGGWFIVSAMLPTGLISNHYVTSDWDLFKIPEVEKALFEFDGHTGADVLQRLKQLT